MKESARYKQNNRCNRSGQAMLIAVLSLGGAILGATTVAGLLTLYQIRATTDSENSAKAIFAADTGTEWAKFDHYCATDVNGSGANRCPGVTTGTTDYTLPTFNGSGAAMAVNCYDDYAAEGDTTTTCSGANVVSVITSGIANGSERAFYISYAPTLPVYP